MGAKAPRNATALQSSALEGWLTAQPSPNTRAAYCSDLESFGRWCAQHGSIPLTADAATLVAFQTARAEAGDSASTIRRRWSALSSFYDFAVNRHLTSTNPTIGADRPKVVAGDPSPTQRLSPEAVASYRALAAALDPRLEALLALLVSDGLKLGEALALDIDDVSGKPPKTTIAVRRRGESKRVVLDQETAKALRRCVGKRKTGPVFVSERSSSWEHPSRLTRFGADHLIRQLRSENETEPVTANALRRFHISSSAVGGIIIDDIRDRAGLADMRSVRRYTESAIDPSAQPSAEPTESSRPRKDNARQRQSEGSRPERSR